MLRMPCLLNLSFRIMLILVSRRFMHRILLISCTLIFVGSILFVPVNYCSPRNKRFCRKIACRSDSETDRFSFDLLPCWDPDKGDVSWRDCVLLTTLMLDVMLYLMPMVAWDGFSDGNRVSEWSSCWENLQDCSCNIKRFTITRIMTTLNYTRLGSWVSKRSKIRPKTPQGWCKQNLHLIRLTAHPANFADTVTSSSQKTELFVLATI